MGEGGVVNCIMHSVAIFGWLKCDINNVELCKLELQVATFCRCHDVVVVYGVEGIER